MAHIGKVLGRDGKPTGRWVAQVYLGRHPETGRTRWKARRFAREKDAAAWVRSEEGRKDEGLNPPTSTKASLGEYLLGNWLPSYRTQVRSTYSIEKTLGKWVLRPRADTPFLGRIALHKLTVHDFDRLYVAMVKAGMRGRGIAHLHGVLKRALKAAVRKGELPRNPAEFATVPRPEVQAEITSDGDEDIGPVRALTREQTLRFLAVAREDRLSALWHVLLDGGLRPGEAFALEWKHIDVEHGRVKVRATLTRQGVPKRAGGGQGWKRTKPKTPSSLGDVPLSAATMQELRRWRKQQAEERLKVGAEWQDHGFVFTTEFGTPLGNNVGRLWRRVLALADGGKGDLGIWGEQPAKPRSGPTAQRPFKPRFSPYVLRHTCATLALLDGVDLLQVSRRLRHKNITITAQFYGHVRAEHTQQAAESFNRLAVAAQAMEA